MPISSDAHKFITGFAAFWIFIGLVCWALGDGVLAFLGCVMGVLALGAIVGRVGRG